MLCVSVVINIQYTKEYLKNKVMEIIDAYKLTFIQFELKDRNGHHLYYRRCWEYDDWEQLCGDSWEPLNFSDELEEIYQKYKLTDGYDSIHKS
jgi:hypothetical protein